jgi:hypothetical protein
MATWRMAMRRGYRGEDMFRHKCRELHLAAITYEPIQQIDLSRFSREDAPPGWDKLASSQKGSISKFAWEIRGGDKLYVRDSDEPNLLVAFGHILGKDGKLAYFYDEDSPIKTESGDVWRHLLRVDWDDTFQPLPYKDHSANTTVLRLDESELELFHQEARRKEYKNHGFSDADTAVAEELETAYPRATPATIRLILPKHRTLSKAFQRWLANARAIQGHPERRQIDMQFSVNRVRAMAEFKIAYDGNTKAAIREALGQILEYNQYPGRDLTRAWFLVLDREPSANDIRFIESLRVHAGCPLFLGWQLDSGFTFHPKSPLG